MISIFALLIFFNSSPSLAAIADQCAAVLLENSVPSLQQLEIALKVPQAKYRATPKEFNDLLSEVPDFLKQREPPVGQELKAILDSIPLEQAQNFFGKDLHSIEYHGIHIEDSVLDFVKKNFIFKGDYYFVGNGMNVFHKTISKLFDGTAASKNIKSLKVSRDLFEPENESFEAVKTKLFKYFKKLEFEKDKDRKIILIDSLTAHNGNNHSLFKLADLAVEYLESNGYSRIDALNKVVTIAIPELGAIEDTYTVSSDSSAAAKDLIEKTLKYAKINSPSNQITRPTLVDDTFSNPQLAFAFRSVPRWQTFYKYSVFDPKTNEPTGAFDDFTRLLGEKEPELRVLRNMVAEKLRYLYYLKLIDAHFELVRSEPDSVQLINQVENTLQ